MKQSLWVAAFFVAKEQSCSNRQMRYLQTNYLQLPFFNLRNILKYIEIFFNAYLYILYIYFICLIRCAVEQTSPENKLTKYI